MSSMPERAGNILGRFRSARRLAAIALTLALGSACREPTASLTARGVRDIVAGDPHFLQLAPNAPPYAEMSASFYAKRTEERGVEIYFHPAPGAIDSTKFLDFRVPAGALATAPDGTPYTDADSVLITVTVTDPQRMIVTFEPSGLRFAVDNPAQMTLSFLEADNDVNADGAVDTTDAMLKSELAIWVQETPGAPWSKLPSTVFLDVEQLVVAVPGFSGYAAAY